VKMRRCEDEKVRYRPPLLEEPCAQTLSGKNGKTGELGQDRLEVRWEAVMFLFNVVNLNV